LLVKPQTPDLKANDNNSLNPGTPGVGGSNSNPPSVNVEVNPQIQIKQDEDGTFRVVQIERNQVNTLNH